MIRQKSVVIAFATSILVLSSCSSFTQHSGASPISVVDPNGSSTTGQNSANGGNSSTVTGTVSETLPTNGTVSNANLGAPVTEAAAISTVDSACQTSAITQVAADLGGSMAAIANDQDTTSVTTPGQTTTSTDPSQSCTYGDCSATDTTTTTVTAPPTTTTVTTPESPSEVALKAKTLLDALSVSDATAILDALPAALRNQAISDCESCISQVTSMNMSQVSAAGCTVTYANVDACTQILTDLGANFNVSSN